MNSAFRAAGARRFIFIKRFFRLVDGFAQKVKKAKAKFSVGRRLTFDEMLTTEPGKRLAKRFLSAVVAAFDP
jgi:hypothetical protein